MARGLLEIKVDPNTARSLRALTRFRGKHVLDHAGKVMKASAPGFGGRVQKAAARYIGSDTGNLLSSIKAQSFEVDGLPAIRVGVFTGDAAKYAAAHEYGTRDLNRSSPVAVIRPKKGRAMAFAPEGSPAAGKSPRQYRRKLVRLPASGGHLATVVGRLVHAQDLKAARRKKIDVGQVQTVFLLISKLSVRPKRFLSRAVTDSFPYLEKRLSEALGRAVEVSIA